METANDRNQAFEKTKNALEKNHLPGGNKKKADIVQ